MSAIRFVSSVRSAIATALRASGSASASSPRAASTEAWTAVHILGRHVVVRDCSALISGYRPASSTLPCSISAWPMNAAVVDSTAFSPIRPIFS